MHLKDAFFVSKGMVLIGRKRYSLLIELCSNRLKEKGNNYGALYILSLTYFYKKEIEKSFDYFSLLLHSNVVKRKITSWFIENLVARTLYQGNDCKLALTFCEKINDYSLRKKNAIEILKIEIVANYNCRNYKEALEKCRELESINYKDEELERIKKKLIKMVEQ